MQKLYFDGTNCFSHDPIEGRKYNDVLEAVSVLKNAPACQEQENTFTAISPVDPNAVFTPWYIVRLIDIDL